MHRTRFAIHVELKNTRNHNDGVGLIPIFEQREPERFCAVDEQSTTKAMLVLNNPIAAAVPSDKEERSP
jgi:hypothetical protein